MTENFNNEDRPILSNNYLQHLYEEAIAERIFQESEVNRMQNEVNRLKNMIDGNINIPVLNSGLNQQINTS